MSSTDRMFVDDNAGAGVTDHRIFAELREHFGGGGNRAVHFHHFPDLADVRRIVADLLQNAFLMDAGALRTATDQRKNRPDQDVVRSGARVRNLVHDDVFNSFADNLLHQCQDSESGMRVPTAMR